MSHYLTAEPTGNESDAFKLGWNANNIGNHFLSNPFGHGFLHDEWNRGFRTNEALWNDPDYSSSKLKAFQVPSVQDVAFNFSNDI
jgi:hypothetical protein